MAKLIIRLLHGIAAVVNTDPISKGQLQVAFLPDYNVKLSELIIPAADLSEQIGELLIDYRPWEVLTQLPLL